MHNPVVHDYININMLYIYVYRNIDELVKQNPKKKSLKYHLAQTRQIRIIHEKKIVWKKEKQKSKNNSCFFLIIA